MNYDTNRHELVRELESAFTLSTGSDGSTDGMMSFPSSNLSSLNDSLFPDDILDEGGGHTRRRKFNLSLLDLERLFPTMEAVSADMQVFLIAVYSLAAALSLLGNVTVILVLAFGKRSSVRCYLINLAVSDITMAAFCIPFSYTSKYVRNATREIVASMSRSVVREHKALVHPLNTRWTKSRSRLVIGCIWVFSVGISIVPLVVSDAERFNWGGEWYYECKEQWPRTQNEVYEKTYTVVLFVLTFALPVGGLGYTYLSIVAMMCAYRMPGNAEPSRDQHHLHAKIKMINMMIAVMVCFVLSWLPLQVLQFLIYFVPEITQCRGRQCFTYYMSFFVCHWVAMANSFMNPFIYCFMSKNFREDFLQFLRKCGCRRDTRRRRSPPWSHSDLGSSFRSILNITHKTSVQSPSRAGLRARQDSQREPEDTELRLLQPSHGSLRDYQVCRSSAKWRVVRSSSGRGVSGRTVLAVKTSAVASTIMRDPYKKTNGEHHHDSPPLSCITQRPNEVSSPAPKQCSPTLMDTQLTDEISEIPDNNCFTKVNLQREN
ncbi:RYamide receptor-like [Portunus trituberculatus]|uniref:RYamide receptor-like n=1 Tax=Portunus trituberculatus TaxID=210409 RepID=UPI001E1D0069|nr:RYamide receptor-like [Portunus trituberculatus]